MLPDLDSDSGIPLRETLAFAAAVTPMLMVDRLAHFGLSHESIALAGACIYIIIRFGIGEVLRRYTVHRGMWHSIPAAIIAGLVAWMVCSCENINMRLFKAGAVVLGYMIHLALDEWYSVYWRRGRLRLKNSFGSAMKLWSKDSWANGSTYIKLVILVAVAVGDPMLMEKYGYHETNFQRVARKVVRQLLGDEQRPLR
jgi:hypothetical protein